MTNKSQTNKKSIILLLIMVAVFAALYFTVPFLKNAAADIAPAPSTTDNAGATDGISEESDISADSYESVRALALIGDRLVPMPEGCCKEDLVREEWQDDENLWIWLEDSSRVEKGTMEDLSFLASFSKLEVLLLINQSATRLPALSGLENLRQLRIWDCGFTDIEGLRNCKALTGLTIRTNYMIDCSPIGSCPKLQELNLELRNGCPKLEFLSSLEALTEFNCSCEACSGIDGIASNKKLNKFRLELTGEKKKLDLSCLKGLKLTELRLSSVETDFLFLKGRPGLMVLEVFGDPGSWDGLADISRIDELYFDARGGSCEALLSASEKLKIKSLSLFNCENMDLSLVPKSVQELSLDSCEIDSLEGLTGKALTGLELVRLDRLRSLNGIERLERLQNLSVSLCLHISDWEHVYNRRLQELKLSGLYLLPDFSRLQFVKYGVLGLENIPGLTGADCLGTIPEELKSNPTFSVEILGGDVNSLDGLNDFRAYRLTVSSGLEEQAEKLISSGCFQMYEISQDDIDCEDVFDSFSLASLEELDTFPDYVLAKVKRLYIGGNECFSEGRFEWNGDKTSNCCYYFYPNRENSETVSVSYGEIRDISRFSKLTGLEELVLVNQPIESLEGIQSFSKLRVLELVGCDIADISPAFSLDSLEELRLEHCPLVSSIDGIQRLNMLNSLNVRGTPVKDFSPLKEFAEPEHLYPGGFGLMLNANDYSCLPEDFSFLSAFNSFKWLELHGCPAEEWLDYVRDADIRRAYLFECFSSTEELERFISTSPDLVELNIEWNTGIDSLEALLSMERLECVRVSGNMEFAIISLADSEYSFRFEISS